jgi:hypothetical protein
LGQKENAVFRTEKLAGPCPGLNPTHARTLDPNEM